MTQPSDAFSNAVAATATTQTDAAAAASAAVAAQAAATTLENQLVAANGEVTTLQAANTSLQGQVATLTSANTSLQSQVASLQGQAAMLTTDNAALTAQVSSLQAQVAVLQADEASEHDTPTVFRGINATTTAAHDARKVLFSPVTAWRYYQNPGEPIAWPKEYTLGPGEVLVYSAKVNPKQIANGSQDAAVRALFTAAPKDRPFYYCVWHEPEDDIVNGTFTAADLKAAWARVAPIARSVGSHIVLTPILMGYTWSTASHRTWTDYVPAASDWDALGVDTYALGSIGLQDPAKVPTMFDTQKAAVVGAGKRFLITETGVGQNVSGQARLDAVTALGKAAAGTGAELVTYFTGESGAQEWGLNSSEVAAYFRGLGWPPA